MSIQTTIPLMAISNQLQVLSTMPTFCYVGIVSILYTVFYTSWRWFR